MQTFVYKQTQTFYLHVDAETQAEAEAIADETEIIADEVFVTDLAGWEAVKEAQCNKAM